LVRRITVWLDLLVHQVPIEVLRERWSLRLSCLSQWRQALLLRSMDRLVSHHSGGRRPPGTPRQNKRLVALWEAGPQVGGGETAWWTSGRIRVLLWRACGVLSHCPSGCPWLHNVGVAFQQARVVSDHLDAVRRHAWLHEEWPRILRAAKRRQGLLRFEEEARCAQGGREAPRGRAVASTPRAKRVAHAKAPRSWALWSLLPDAGALRASRDGVPRTVTTRACAPSWRRPRPPCCSSMTGRGIIPVRRPRHVGPSMPIASRGIRCRRMRPTPIPLHISGSRPRSARPIISTARHWRGEPYRWRRPWRPLRCILQWDEGFLGATVKTVAWNSHRPLRFPKANLNIYRKSLHRFGV
jgi:hypothetical protein